ncbi:pyroglutamyl-peptidase I [Aeoliella mucimassa]|uniref:Pyrrolidone-carboxylate peptidase n=1 Tax=Aeoliella mucimassa TaxID=2527972 RepID=A0A518ARV8_9BACT|nr:pyroglutamyl-peptidase I [Aeoliella mucimassa]QDU57463.1 Pyrrolidone-carboxylate peptidase [Aeoliella mucimassa]
MPKVLLTAYAPYDDWSANASWMVLQEVTRDLPAEIELVTRLYPVDFAEMTNRLGQDLTSDIDIAIHLGQAPGNSRIDLESVAINCGKLRDQRPEEAWPLVEGGPVAYQSSLPLAEWARQMRSEGVPAEVSHHAGTYLCNAILYMSHHLSVENALGVQSAFMHVPVAPEQVIARRMDLASLPIAETARGLRVVLDDIAARVPAR